MAVKNRLELADRAHFDDLTKLMEGVANFDFYDLKQRYGEAGMWGPHAMWGSASVQACPCRAG